MRIIPAEENILPNEVESGEGVILSPDSNVTSQSDNSVTSQKVLKTATKKPRLDNDYIHDTATKSQSHNAMRVVVCSTTS